MSAWDWWQMPKTWHYPYLAWIALAPNKGSCSILDTVIDFLRLHDLGPTYLLDLMQRYYPARNPCPKSKSLLCVPQLSLNFYGARAFAVAAAA